MLIPTKNRKAIHEELFQEGVLVAKKDFNAAKHLSLDIPNLQVIKAMQSLNSRGYVKTTFSWQYYYYTLTAEGLAFLRSELHLPEGIVPATHKKSAKPNVRAPTREREDRPQKDQDSYRRRGAEEKKVGADADFKPEFRAGLNRARPE